MRFLMIPYFGTEGLLKFSPLILVVFCDRESRYYLKMKEADKVRCICPVIQGLLSLREVPGDDEL